MVFSEKWAQKVFHPFVSNMKHWRNNIFCMIWMLKKNTFVPFSRHYDIMKAFNSDIWFISQFQMWNSLFFNNKLHKMALKILITHWARILLQNNLCLRLLYFDTFHNYRLEFLATCIITNYTKFRKCGNVFVLINRIFPLL